MSVIRLNELNFLISLLPDVDLNVCTRCVCLLFLLLLLLFLSCVYKFPYHITSEHSHHLLPSLHVRYFETFQSPLALKFVAICDRIWENHLVSKKINYHIRMEVVVRARRH